ncbi:hypothetical protein V500_02664 [Pseudogymnoascus sp. VKM F-4518 (FW-2643)]|nr:hypothetical protein V500_02664 [Pseudogymnoascus sp. VKM F-4518 (FW-2643)]
MRLGVRGRIAITAFLVRRRYNADHKRGELIWSHYPGRWRGAEGREETRTVSSAPEDPLIPTTVHTRVTVQPERMMGRQAAGLRDDEHMAWRFPDLLWTIYCHTVGGTDADDGKYSTVLPSSSACTPIYSNMLSTQIEADAWTAGGSPQDASTVTSYRDNLRGKLSSNARTEPTQGQHT